MLDDCVDRTYNSPRSTKIEHQTEGGNTMAKAKRYTAEQLSDAEKMAAALANCLLYTSPSPRDTR